MIFFQMYHFILHTDVNGEQKTQYVIENVEKSEMLNAGRPLFGRACFLASFQHAI